MFAFMDTDGDGFVDPQDWVDGLSGVDSAHELAGVCISVCMCVWVGVRVGVEWV